MKGKYLATSLDCVHRMCGLQSTGTIDSAYDINACHPYESTIDEPHIKGAHIAKRAHLIHMSLSYC